MWGVQSIKQSFIFDIRIIDILYYQHSNSYQEDQRYMALIFFCRFGYAQRSRDHTQEITMNIYT